MVSPDTFSFFAPLTTTIVPPEISAPIFNKESIVTLPELDTYSSSEDVYECPLIEMLALLEIRETLNVSNTQTPLENTTLALAFQFAPPSKSQL